MQQVVTPVGQWAMASRPAYQALRARVGAEDRRHHCPWNAQWFGEHVTNKALCNMR